MIVHTVDAMRSRRLITRPPSGSGLRYARLMTSPSANVGAATSAHDRLVAALREHALVIGEVTLTSGRKAQYYVDAKRAILLPGPFAALAELVAAQLANWGATAVGGMTMGADPVACAALAGGAPVKAFFIRKETK